MRAHSLLVLLTLLGLGCADAPFARVNPNDSASGYTGYIVLSRDTVSVDNPRVAARVVLEPAVYGYQPEWDASNTKLLHEGAGVFRLNVAPTSTVQTVRIEARFRSGSMFDTVYIAATP